MIIIIKHPKGTNVHVTGDCWTVDVKLINKTTLSWYGYRWIAYSYRYAVMLAQSLWNECYGNEDI